MSHPHCVLDGRDTYQVNVVRGHRLMVAEIHDDDAAAELVLDELQGCAACHSALTTMLAALVARWLSNTMGEAVAVKMLELKLSDAIDGLSTGAGRKPVE